jgi:hypothetical protein
MSASTDLITVFRSADEYAEDQATEARDRLAAAGIEAVILDDSAAGVVVGSYEVRVRTSELRAAEAILAIPPRKENEDEVTKTGASHELDFVAVFKDQAPDAEMEALAVKGMLESAGIPAVVIGSPQIPSLPFEVRVPKSRLEEAKALMESADRGEQTAE